MQRPDASASSNNAVFPHLVCSPGFASRPNLAGRPKLVGCALVGNSEFTDRRLSGRRLADGPGFVSNSRFAAGPGPKPSSQQHTAPIRRVSDQPADP